MEDDIYLKRKIYDELVRWNSDPNKLPLIVDGLRQVGKSYIVNKFAHDKFENVITFDFRSRKDLRKIFDGNLDVDSLIRNATPYFPNQSFIPNKTILIFEEIGDCPLARTSLKFFALDKRFAVIATGSLLGVINYRRKQKIDISAGYEKVIHLSSLDFEEFLWANGVSIEAIDVLKGYTKRKEELPSALSSFYIDMIKRYVVIGGMPKSVKEYLKTNSFSKSREILEGLLNDYRGDFGRYVNDKNEEEIDYKLQQHLNQIFDSIPEQLSRETDSFKFKLSSLKSGARYSEYRESFFWLEKAGLILRCFNLKAIEKPLEANKNESSFKVFLSDIGLLMAMFPLTTSQRFLRDELDSRKGAIFENLLAVFIYKEGFPLYYFLNGSEHLEIDFILEDSDGILLFEEKSVNGKMRASRMVMENKSPYHAKACYKIIRSSFAKGDFYISIPHFASPFLLEDIANKIKKDTKIGPLKYLE